MIQLADFQHGVRDLLRELNAPQIRCVDQPANAALMIVAGPGSGKTTVLVLRALRHVFVDGMPPESVLITTFTRKAAGELSSRLIDWGLGLLEHFRTQAKQARDATLVSWLEGLDITSIRTGTLDSFCQEWLGTTKEVGSPSPVMLEQFAADFVFRRRVFGPLYREPANAAVLGPYLGQFSFSGRPPSSQTEAADLSTQMNGRLVQDLVDVGRFGASSAAAALQASLLNDYRTHLQNRQMFDFALAAERILAGLIDGTLYQKLEPIGALLVDEYQDTNPLQEGIYFQLARQSGSSLTIVGDDDQALYRFRGATVELFTNFRARIAERIPGTRCDIEYLLTNHRSTPSIVQFFNHLSTHDAAFAPARVVGKPQIAPFNAENGIPILGLFRDNLDALADDLSQLLVDVFSGAGRVIPGTQASLKGADRGGSIGDAVLLASSVREFKSGQNGALVSRLPALLRTTLAIQGHGVFNPRGQDLRDLPNVSILLGLVLLCIDASDGLEGDQAITREARRYFPSWRDSARAFIDTNPAPRTATSSLQTYVEGWRRKRPSTGTWPREIPLLDLLYKLIVWMPAFQNDPEHQIYLEAIMRCVAQGSHYSSYAFTVLEEEPHATRSRLAVMRDLLAPVAENSIEVDEGLLFAVPKDRLSIMTIHQSKGLEYPLVIVDVGSEFGTNHHLQAFRRFPIHPSSTVRMETALAPYTEVGGVRTARNDLDRTFDDLIRLYYVAFSRPQSALLLVGLTKSIEYATSVMNIATFWTRDGTWHWRHANPPMRRGFPPMADRIPLTLI